MQINLRVNTLFATFVTAYSHKFTSSFSSDPEQKEFEIKVAKKRWRSIVEKLTDEQLAHGTSVCMVMCNFPPTINEFVKAALDILDDGQAFVKALESIRTGKDSDNVFVRDAVNKMDLWVFRHSDDVNKQRFIFLSHYKDVINNELKKFCD